MSLREKLEVLERVAEISTLAGLKGVVDEDRLHFKAGFAMADDRSQVVYVRVLDQKVGDSPVLTFFSPCLMVKTGFMKGISKEQALDLLRRNEQVMFARFGVLTMDAMDMVVASVDHLLDTLDPDEFKSSMWFVAMAADAYEKEFGQDQF